MLELVDGGDGFLQPLLDARRAIAVVRELVELGVRIPHLAERLFVRGCDLEAFLDGCGELLVLVRELALRFGELVLEARQLPAEGELGLGVRARRQVRWDDALRRSGAAASRAAARRDWTSRVFASGRRRDRL